MTDGNLIPVDDASNDGATKSEGKNLRRRAPDPFSQDGMPLALLEFHSPSAALINLPPTPAAKNIIWIVAALFGAGLIASAIFPLNRVVSAPGRMVSTEPTLVVQPLDTAIVRSIDVKVGQFVQKGQVLAHLDPTLSKADLTNMKLQRDSYQAEVDRLRAEADGKEYQPDVSNPASVDQAAAFQKRKQEYTAKVAQYDGQIAALQSHMEGALANAAMYRNRARISGEVLTMRQNLQHQQVGSRLSTLSAQADLAESERSQISSQEEAASYRSQLSGARGEKDNYIQGWKGQIYADLSLAEHHLNEAVSDYDKARLRGRLVLLKAPQDAVVLTISRYSIGSVVTTGQQIMTLVPTGYGLETEAMLRGEDVGFVQTGDSVILKFSTFPYDQYGGAEGTVTSISADAFGNDGTVDGQPGSSSQGATRQTPDGAELNGSYRVRIRVDRYTLRGVPNFFHPIPGMPVTADVAVGKRTLMRYFLNRLVPAATNGFREPSGD